MTKAEHIYIFVGKHMSHHQSGLCDLPLDCFRLMRCYLGSTTGLLGIGIDEDFHRTGPLLGRERLYTFENRPSFSALQCSCRPLRLVSNYFCTSIQFGVEDLDIIIKCLPNLPNVIYLSMNFDQGHDVLNTLLHLHSLKPQLTTLVLRRSNTQSHTSLAQASIGGGILQWSSSLVCLELYNIQCGSLDWLSKMLFLRALKLHMTDPPLSYWSIYGCTQLQELSVHGANAVQSNNFILTFCSTLRYASCIETSLTSLDVAGLSNLVSLNCSCNKLKSLDVSSCVASRDLDCAHNQLTVLDITKNGVLEALDCSQNPLYRIGLI